MLLETTNYRRKNYLIKKYKNDVKYFIRFNYKDEISKEAACKKLKKKKIL